MDQNFICTKLSSVSLTSLELVRNNLRALSSGTVADVDEGICINIDPSDVTSVSEWNLLIEQFYVWWQDWPLYSGQIAFPVRIDGRSGMVCYHDLPKWEGEYGDKRKALCKFLFHRLDFYIQHVRNCDPEVIGHVRVCYQRCVDVLGMIERGEYHTLPNVGVCGVWTSGLDSSVNSIMMVKMLGWIKGIVGMWPKRSDSDQYVVPSCNDMDHSIQYAIAQHSGTMWVGDYGTLRIELLRFVIGVVGALLYTFEETALGRQC